MAEQALRLLRRTWPSFKCAPVGWPRSEPSTNWRLPFGLGWEMGISIDLSYEVLVNVISVHIGGGELPGGSTHKITLNEA